MVACLYGALRLRPQLARAGLDRALHHLWVRRGRYETRLAGVALNSAHHGCMDEVGEGLVIQELTEHAQDRDTLTLRERP